MELLRAVFPAQRNPLIGEWVAASRNLDPFRELTQDEEGCGTPNPCMFIADAERDGRVTAIGTGSKVIRIHRRGVAA